MLLRDYEDGSRLALPADSEWLALVRDILENEEVQSMKAYLQHGRTSCLQHSVNVSWLAYRYCLRYPACDATAAARAGLLHDLFLYDWHDRNEKRRGFHGFTHPRCALNNARRLFHLSDMECSIILHHMWPLTLIPPRYAEAYIVSAFDKYSSFTETLHRSSAVVCGGPEGRLLEVEVG